MFWQKFKRILFFTGIAICTILFLVAGFTFVFQDKIKRFAITEINNQLKGKLIVKGEIGFSLFSHFPKATINFSDIVLRDNSASNPDFISAKSFGLGFNTFDLLHGKYNIDAVFIEDASIHCVTYKNGATNFDVFKKSNSSTKQSAIKIESLSAKKVLLLVENQNSNFVFQNLIHHFKGDGKVEGDLITANFESENEIGEQSISLPEFTFHQPLLFKGAIKINIDKNDYQFDETTILLADNEFEINGNLKLDKEINLNLKAKNLSIENIITLAPKKIKEKLKGINSKGLIGMELNLKGVIQNNQMPEVVGSFSWKDGKLSLPNWKNDFENISMNGNIKAEKNDWKINIEKFNSAMLEHPFLLQMNIENNHHQTEINLNADGNLSVKDLLNFLTERPQSADGQIVLHHLETSLIVSPNNKIQNFVASNSIELNNISANFKDWKLENINGKISTDSNYLIINPTNLRLNGNDMNCTGKFPLKNLLSDKKDFIQMTVAADKISINSLMVATSDKKDTSKTWIDFPLHLKTSCKTITWDKLILNDVAADMILHDSIISILQFYTNTQNGTLNATGNMLKSSSSLPFNYIIDFKKLDIASTFHQFNNFNQQIITEEKIKGALSGKAIVHGNFDRNFIIKPESITATTDFLIENGELNNVTQLMSMSKYLKVKDLEHLKFATLKNQVEINNRKIILPEMNIKSNAVNLTLSGFHKFDNDIDYLVKVSLLEVFARKLGKSEDADWEQDEKSGFNVFIRMTGNASNPKIIMNKKASRQKFKENMKAEQQTMQKLIKAELKGEQPKEKPIDFKQPDKIELINWDDSIK